MRMKSFIYVQYKTLKIFHRRTGNRIVCGAFFLESEEMSRALPISQLIPIPFQELSLL